MSWTPPGPASSSWATPRVSFPGSKAPCRTWSWCRSPTSIRTIRRSRRRRRRPLRGLRLRPNERQARGDGDQFAAAFQLGLAEPLGEQPPHGRYERRAAGEEDPVDLVRLQPRSRQGLIGGGGDGGQLRGDPGLEVGAGDGLVDMNGAGFEAERRLFGGRQRFLQARDRLV